METTEAVGETIFSIVFEDRSSKRSIGLKREFDMAVTCGSYVESLHDCTEYHGPDDEKKCCECMGIAESVIEREVRRTHDIDHDEQCDNLCDSCKCESYTHMLHPSIELEWKL
jgi:hypothetical protein